MVDDICDDAFNQLTGLCPVKYELEFTPSTTGWTAITDLLYSELLFNKRKKKIEIPIEAIRYYTSCLYWLRVIGIKEKQHMRKLTFVEHTVSLAFDQEKFAIPESIFLGLKSIGRTTTANGETLAPTFPDLPVTVVQNIPGTLGIASVENHNIYEEHPVIGVAYQGCYERAQTVNKHVYASVVAPSGTTASRNLQGFDSLNETREEALTILYCMGFRPGEFPWTIENSGLSFTMLNTISNVLEQTKIFKLNMVSPLDIEVSGSVAQIIEAKPSKLKAGMLASNTTVRSQSFIYQTRDLKGVSLFYGLNQFKSNLEGQDLFKAITPWSCIKFSAETPPPENWSEQRNQRRNLPERYHEPVFQGGEEDLQTWRITVMSKLAKRNKLNT